MLDLLSGDLECAWFKEDFWTRPRYLALERMAHHLLMTLIGSLGRTGIGLIPDHELRLRTGLSATDIGQALDELEDGPDPLVKRETNRAGQTCYWVIDALDDGPPLMTVRMLRMIVDHVDQLPDDFRLVQEYRERHHNLLSIANS